MFLGTQQLIKQSSCPLEALSLGAKCQINCPGHSASPAQTPAPQLPAPSCHPSLLSRQTALESLPPSTLGDHDSSTPAQAIGVGIQRDTRPHPFVTGKSCLSISRA